MKDITYYTPELRRKWPAGEWDSEPDKAQWADPSTGLPCLIVRNMLAGNLCGYVGVPRSHKVYGLSYREVYANVHGGLTYANHCQPRGRICHVVEPGEPDDVWWLGFDCSHSNDLCPDDADMPKFTYESSYQDFEYVKSQVQTLANQLHKMTATKEDASE